MCLSPPSLSFPSPPIGHKFCQRCSFTASTSAAASATTPTPPRLCRSAISLSPRRRPARSASLHPHIIPLTALPPTPLLRPPQPKYKLTDEQAEVLAQFRRRMSDLKEPQDRLFVDDACLVRYLRAREYNLAEAEELLRGTLLWRKEYGIEDISAESMAVGKSAPWTRPSTVASYLAACLNSCPMPCCNGPQSQPAEKNTSTGRIARAVR